MGNNLAELRWKNGWRVYFLAVLANKKIVLIIDGHKNEQEKTLKKHEFSLDDLQSIKIDELKLKASKASGLFKNKNEVAKMLSLVIKQI